MYKRQAKGNVDIQAQHDIRRVQAQQDITIGSANTAVEYAAPKRIRSATAAGASIVQMCIRDRFNADARLYRLQGEGALASLQVCLLYTSRCV